MGRVRYNLLSILSFVSVVVIILIIFGTGPMKTYTGHSFEGKSKGNSSPFDHKAVLAAFNEARVDQEDPRLIQLIRDYYIDPPSDKEYNFENLTYFDTSRGQAQYVDGRLNAKKHGFYVECGAFNGEYLSNSMFFERARNWTGLLIEADPVTYQILKKKNRKAYSVNACLSTKPYPFMVTFRRDDVLGRIEEDDDQKRRMQQFRSSTKDRVQVQCFPLTSILLALDRTTVDYFSLDIEGDELKVLKTIPMKKIHIQIMSVEVTDKTRASEDLTSYLSQVGFAKLTHMTSEYLHIRDSIFESKH